MITKQELASRLRTARRAADITQEQMAKRLRVPRTAVTQIELCNRNISTLELARWAEVVSEPIAFFFE